MDTLSKRLKEAMNKIDITQSELVRRTGINKGALSSYISGRYEPKQKAIYELAKALNVNEAWLMGYDVSSERHDNNSNESPDFSLTPHEKEHLTIYRSLDDKGQHTVDTVAKMEMDRMKGEK